MRKAGALCDKLTPGNKKQAERGYGEGKHGGWGVLVGEGGGRENGEKDISFIDLRLVHKNRRPFICSSSEWLSQKTGPSYRERDTEKQRERKQNPSALQSKLANVELSDLSVETIHTE